MRTFSQKTGGEKKEEKSKQWTPRWSMPSFISYK